jgi:hypothetical protein
MPVSVFRIRRSGQIFKEKMRGALLGWLLAGGLGLRALAGTAGLTAQPLAPHATTPPVKLFTELPAAKTGIVTENNYADPRMWTERYHEFEVGSIGSGVAIGDYDGDGRPDILVASKTEGIRLFRNLGDWKFEDVSDKAGLRPLAPDATWAKGAKDKDGNPIQEWVQGVTFADVNNDGRLDLYVCRFNAPNWLFINQGNGTFKEEAAARGLAVTDACVMASFCDYDRDGALDVYIQTNLLSSEQSPDGQRDYLFHNNGDGTFANVTDRAGISGLTQGHSATWWDYDGDGWPDLYVANDFAVPDQLYRNNRNGTFTNSIDQVVPHMPFSSMGADIGDVNNDGLMDFYVADMAATTPEKDLRTMADHRGKSRDYPEDGTAPQVLHNALYLNNGSSVFTEVSFLAGLSATDWTWSVRLEDLDNDGRLDLQCTNGMHRESHNADLILKAMTAENAIERIRTMKGSPVFNEPNLAFRNLGNLRFQEVGAAWGLDETGVSFGAAYGDLDGDGDLDLVYTNYHKGVTVLRNDSASGHRLTVALQGTRSNRFGLGATVRLETAAGPQVRQLFPSRGYLSSSEPIVHFGLGDETAVRQLTVSWPSGHVQVFKDVAADQRLTITEPDSTPPALSVPSAPVAQFSEVSQSNGLSFTVRETALDELLRQPLLPFRQNRRGPALAVGDLTGSGRDDIILGGTPRDPTRILVVDAPSHYTAVDAAGLAQTGPLSDGPALLFDADGDNTTDLLLTHGGTALPANTPDYQPRLFLNHNNTGLQPAAADALPALPLSIGAAVAADFDHDGKLDVFLGGRTVPGQYPVAPASALLRNRGGTFEDVTDQLAPGLRKVGLVTSALWTDVDNDGWPDLLLALEWGTVRYWHNRAGQGFEDLSDAAGFAAAGSGWWNSLATADFNGDGRMDYVAGNLGLNTQYHAAPDAPAVLYRGDFKGTGGSQLVEARSDHGRLLPWRARKQLVGQIPAIAKRFPTTDGYARASVGELLDADKLASAKMFSATEFRSGVFLSQPDGRYRFEPLPLLAQVAPGQGMAAGDFDGDGKADIFLVQNSYSPIPAVGRFDSGLGQWLGGDGKGGWTLRGPAESGLLVRGDAKALVVLDLDRDGWPDFVVSRNNGTTLAFRNGGVASRHSFGVRLNGPRGNPSAIGARITVELADGSTQSSEVSAGSGYYSQSGATQFFGYRDGNPPRNITVRWPGGASTTTESPHPDKLLILGAP